MATLASVHAFLYAPSVMIRIGDWRGHENVSDELSGIFTSLGVRKTQRRPSLTRVTRDRGSRSMSEKEVEGAFSAKSRQAFTTEAGAIATVRPDKRPQSASHPSTRSIKAFVDSPPCVATEGSESHARKPSGSDLATSSILRPRHEPKSTSASSVLTSAVTPSASALRRVSASGPHQTRSDLGRDPDSRTGRRLSISTGPKSPGNTGCLGRCAQTMSKRCLIEKPSVRPWQSGGNEGSSDLRSV